MSDIRQTTASVLDINKITGLQHQAQDIDNTVVNSTIVKSVEALENLALTAKDGQRVELQDGVRSGVFYFDSSRSSENDGGTIFNGMERQYNIIAKVEWFDTIQNALDAGINLTLNSDYIETSMSINNKISLSGSGSITASTSVDKFITINADDVELIGISINGNGKATKCVWTNKSISLKNTSITGAYSENNGTAANVMAQYTEPKILKIQNCDLRGASGITSGNIGDANGSCRSVYFSTTTEASGAECIIDNGSKLGECYAREGDSFHYQNSSSDYESDETKVSINNSYIFESNRRLLKLAGGRAEIKNCVLNSISPDSTNYLNPDSIFSIYGYGDQSVTDFTISGNVINDYAGNGSLILIQSCNKGTFSNNTHKYKKEDDTSVINRPASFKDSYNIDYSGNSIEIAAPFYIRDNENVTIFNNNFTVVNTCRSFFEGAPSGATIKFIKNTINYSDFSKGELSFYGIYYSAVQGAFDKLIISGNYIEQHSNSGRGHIVRYDKESTGVFVSNNQREGASDPLYINVDDDSNLKRFNNYNSLGVVSQ